MQSCSSHIQPELLLKEMITLAHPFIHVIPHFASLQCLPSLCWLCTHFPFIFKSFIPILSCFHLAFICHFSPLPDKEFWFHYFFFFLQTLFCFPHTSLFLSNPSKREVQQDSYCYFMLLVCCAYSYHASPVLSISAC